MSLAGVISEVAERIDAADRISLFLDFDGTLVPIMADPAKPRLDPDVAETLRRLADRDALATTIISGRAVQDLYSRIRLEGLIYAGNHGLEIFGRHLCFIEPVAASLRPRLERVCEALTAALGSFAGILVEYKGLTASVHYRLAQKEDLGPVQEAVYAIMAANSMNFRLNRGRKVFEIVPRTNWHKGTAVRFINRQLGGNAVAVYLGDDTSDEDAFKALPDAITIKVGAARVTDARYRLPNPDAVHDFLVWLLSRRPQETPKVTTQ